MVARARQDAREGSVPCQAVKQVPASAPLHPWTWPEKPWQRVHIDFTGPFQGKMFFLAIDAHSKWGEIFEMMQTTTTSTYHSYGLPEQIISDNGPQSFLMNSEILFRKMASGTSDALVTTLLQMG